MQLWLVDTDVVIDYPKSVMPTEIHVGGLTTRESSPLPKALHDLLQNSSHGVIIVSFGSRAILTGDQQAMMLAVFAKLQHTIVWGIPTYEQPSRVPHNVVLMDWLPQNGLLGHHHVKLFVTHCGINGQFEAMYHGVPMLGLPVDEDQHYNAQRMLYHGFGEVLDLRSMTSRQFFEAMHRILNNESYAKNIRRASEIYRNRPMSARQRATYWIEHVLKYGGIYLRSHAVNMAWYEYLMLDILCIVQVAGCSLILFLYCVTRYVVHQLMRHQKQKQV